MVSLPHRKGHSGSDLPSQKANLNMIGCDTAEELACVLASTLLGGELSYYAARDMHYMMHMPGKRNTNDDWNIY